MSNSQKFDVAGLLRDPGAFVVEAKDSGKFGKLVGFLVLLTLIGTALFGAALGSFVDDLKSAMESKKYTVELSPKLERALEKEKKLKEKNRK